MSHQIIKVRGYSETQVKSDLAIWTITVKAKKPDMEEAYPVVAAYGEKVLWHGQERDVLVLQVDGGPLVGMSLLYGNRVTLEIVEDGDVTINPLPCVFALNFFLATLR